MPLIEPEPFIKIEARGLFAEAESHRYDSEERKALTFLAAKIALSHGLIQKVDDCGDLADVETFLRGFGSNTHLIAIERKSNIMGKRPPAAYSWFSEQQAKLVDEPNYFAIIAPTEQRAAHVVTLQGITEAENLRRLRYTGLPPLDHVKKLEDHLLPLVP